MILTIGMIVKNEEKYLRRCLEAIAPILEKVDSELIIADTGSSDSTVEIAKDFTDEVFSFEWSNDFSAARNSTLERAKGEWYMHLDADEIFEDVSEIIEFFNSGEYKKFKSATVVIRNFSSVSQAVYGDFDAHRFIRISENTRYVNKIHEVLPLDAPYKKLSAIANHFGYLTENNKEYLEKKAQRNLKLLLPEMEKDPYNCRRYLEIGQTYVMAGDKELALEYFAKGLQYAKEQKHILLNPLYADSARIMYHLKRYSEVLNVTKEYFKNKKNKSEIDLQMYFLEALSYFEIGKYKEAIVSSKKYMEFFHEYHKGKYHTQDSIYYLIQYTNQNNYRLACMTLVDSLLMEKDYISAGRYLEQIPIADWNDGEGTISRRLNLELKYMEEIGDFSRLILLYNQLNGNMLVLLQTMLESQLENESIRDMILTEIANSDLIKTDYIKLLKLRYNFYCSHSLTKHEVEALVDEIQEWTPLYADMVYFALYCELDIPFAASKINAYELNQFLFSDKFLHFKDMPQLIYKTFKNNDECKDTSSQLWMAFLYMWALNSNRLTNEQTVHLFHAYADTVGAFIAAVYKEEFLREENIGLLPIQLRVGYYCSLAVNSLENGEKSGYIEHLKMVIKLYPGFKQVVGILLEDFQKSMDKSEKEEGLSEFAKYAKLVKQNLDILIAEGKLNQASEILNSYEQLCPDDTEIAGFKKRLEALQ